MNEKPKPVERVIALDTHPDTFTAAILQGPTPAAAITQKIFNKVPMSQLPSWAKKHTTPHDQFVLEASGHSFQVVRTLASCERQAKVLESCQMGKLKEAHANNDKISAVRIGKAYLAGTAKEVWVPDTKTQERRDWLHAHRKATKRLTQVQARLRSYLSDQGVRLKKETKLTATEKLSEHIRQARSWSPRPWQVIEILLLELNHALQQREHWRSLIAQEVLSDPALAAILRLCGVRAMIALALGAFIGDIHRFAHPKKLVKYVGLDPAFDDSGQAEWSGGIGGHGNKYLRCLVIEGAQAILRCSKTPLARWGKKLQAAKGTNLAAAAVARKLIVAVWYLMMGRWTPLEEIDAQLCVKVGKVIGQVGSERLARLGKTAKDLREETYQLLQSARTQAAPPPPAQAPPLGPGTNLPEANVYLLDPDKKFTPKARNHGLAEEYGLR